MDPNPLTEPGWNTFVVKFKLKDNGLRRALATFQKTPAQKHGERLKAISSISQLALNLNRDPMIADIPVVANYLGEVVDAADSEKSDLLKKALAEKTAKTQAVSDQKADAETKKREQQEEQYHVRLLTAFQKLKSGRGLFYEFIICDAKPHLAVMVAPRITAQHKEQLTKLTGGSKRFLHLGTCSFDDGHFVFKIDHPVTGLARKLQDSIKFATGKKFPIVVGDESLADDDEPNSIG